MLVNVCENVLTRRSLWVHDCLNSSLAVGEKNHFSSLCGCLLVVAYGPVQCHFDAAELGSVHRGLALRAEMSAVGDDGITVMDVDGSRTNVAFEATAVGVYQGGRVFLGPLSLRIDS